MVSHKEKPGELLMGLGAVGLKKHQKLGWSLSFLC